MDKFNSKIDTYLNQITMYKLVLWSLRILFVISWILSITNQLPFGFVRPLISISILLAVTYVANYGFAKLYEVNANSESTNITALLLYFIFNPPNDIQHGIYLALAGLIAIASKYVITRKERHIFNPAAFGAVVIGLTGLTPSRWWVGSQPMFIFVLIAGFLVVRKTRRFAMVVSFLFTAGLLAILRNNQSLMPAIRDTIISFPLLFFASYMLTEPMTSPPRRQSQILYGILVGLLFSSRLHIGDNYMTPELALVLGNIFAYFLAPRFRQPLKLLSNTEIGNTIFEYRFSPTNPVSYLPGQYAELTLPLIKSDFRGNRRIFTIASSPTEKDIIFGLKQTEKMSAFKTSLSSYKSGHVISVNNIAGDFVLPTNPKTKLVFIAGGIGITPFRSMLKYLIDNRQTRNITLFYAVSDPKQIVYKDILSEAKDFGLRVVYILTPPEGSETPKSWTGESGRIDKAMITKHVLDYTDRTYYISGPNVMVQSNKNLLKKMKIPRSQIKTDYFSGY